ncbi:MAG: efflux RND transporter periplasmic adaptor subunit [Bacteroidales bacterium]|jgi:membrane fusion protein (multidrug efflux system)
MKYFKAIPVILISVLLVTSCSSKKSNQTEKDSSTETATERSTIPVKVMILAKTKIARTIDYTATILPFEEVNVAPSSPGRIDKIYVEVGDRVNKGDNLFLMDRTQLYAQKVQLASLEKDLSRLDTLLITGSVKQQQYDQAKTQYEVTKTNVDFMEQNTLMQAPFSGVVTGKYFENGEMYSGAPSTASGKSAVVTVMQINPLKINLAVTEQYYPLIKNGMRAMITTDVYEGEEFTGRVFRIAPTINSVTRTFITEIELSNRNDMLKPGMFARVFLDLGEVETFVAPASAVLTQEGTNIRYVFINDNGNARRIEVLPGKRFDDQLELISTDIHEGSMLVVDGQSRLINGDKLDVVK